MPNVLVYSVRRTRPLGLERVVGTLGIARAERDRSDPNLNTAVAGPARGRLDRD